MLITLVRSGRRWVSGGSAPPSPSGALQPLGGATQKMRLLMVLHGEDKSSASSALGWDGAVEVGCGEAVLGSEP